MNYGIDYGRGITNLNVQTGIRYGVISMHAIDPDALADIELNYGDPTCPKCGSNADNYYDAANRHYEHSSGCKDYVCEQCKYVFDSEYAYPDEPVGMEYNAGGYAVEGHNDGDLFVTKSPYYTYAQFCSPCAPGACHLENALLDCDPTCVHGHPRCYALGHEWFENNRAPYRVFKVSDDSEVLPEGS